MTAPIVCTGRPVDDLGRPHGQRCGRIYHRQCNACTRIGPDTGWTQVPNRQHLDAIAEQARAAGWRISNPRPDGTRDAMCARCARPDPTITQGLTTKEHT